MLKKKHHQKFTFAQTIAAITSIIKDDKDNYGIIITLLDD